MDPTIGILAVVVGFVIAGVIQILGQVVTGHNASTLDSAQRQDNRRLAREEFERNALIGLQESVGQLLDFDVLDDPHRFTRANAEVHKYSSRITDGELRALVRELVGAAGAAYADDSLSVSGFLGKVSGMAVAVIERSGDLARATLAEPPRK